ncbi:unnamed protein product [Caenorhabditis sp. 36 PRJEB53466]|nr:unnamed protein product [Caenorhabditis sp. 36 PRJEB53466]
MSRICGDREHRHKKMSNMTEKMMRIVNKYEKDTVKKRKVLRDVLYDCRTIGDIFQLQKMEEPPVLSSLKKVLLPFV